MNSLILKAGQTADLFIGKKSFFTKESKGFPLVLSTDGHVFWPINDFLIHRYITLKKTLGTIEGDASSLSLFAKYLGLNKTQLEDMNNSTFVDYRDFLVNDHKKGQSSQVNKHLHKARRFLVWYDNKLRKDNPTKKRIIGYSTEENHVDAQINIFITEKKKKKKGRTFTTTLYHHEAYLVDSIPKKKHPIASNTIDRLWDAIPTVCKSLERKHRDELTLLLFEELGARRTEVFQITIQACMDAIKTGNIVLVSVKGAPNRTREKKIHPVLKRRLEEYITLVRAPVIKKAIKKGHIPRDHGALLITNSGKPWKQKSFNTELDLLARAAGISEPVAPHLFRHRAHTRLAEESKELGHTKQLLILKASGGWVSDETPATYIDIEQMESPEVRDVLSTHLKNNSNHAIKHLITAKLSELRDRSNDISVLDNVDEIKMLFNSLFSTKQEKSNENNM